MFGSAKATAREAFDAQFEEVAGGVDFRPGGIGEPYRLTLAEQAEAQAAFDRTMRWLPWATLGALFGMIGLVNWLNLDADFSLETATFAIGAFVTGGYVLVYNRAMTAPARLFPGRQVAGENRSKAAVRRAQLRKISWMQIWAPGAIVTVLLVLQLWDAEPGSTGFQLWLLFGIACLAVMLTTVIRKWRLPPED
jgi:hypothetical protein